MKVRARIAQILDYSSYFHSSQCNIQEPKKSNKFNKHLYKLQSYKNGANQKASPFYLFACLLWRGMLLCWGFTYTKVPMRSTHDDQTYLKMPETFSPFGTLCQMELDRFTFLQ